jgi:hypothetical protein
VRWRRSPAGSPDPGKARSRVTSVPSCF